jgi:peptidoglycan hydrolase-like protein with peptidoglycan-binding domain
VDFFYKQKNNIFKITPIFSGAIFVLMFVFLFQSNIVNADNTYIFNKNIKNNVKSQDVNELQKYLNNNGYIVSIMGPGSLGKETNFFGSQTKKAVISFQKNNKLDFDGIVGPLTRDVLNKKNIIVKNIDNKYFIRGRVMGLLGSISLKNNNGDEIIMNLGDKDSFTFPEKIINGENYLVTVNPLYLRQKCNVYYGSGVVNNSDVNNIQVVCIPYKLISGMSGNRDRVIDIKDIDGVTVPVTGSVPVTSIIETSEYTGTVTWSPVSSTFIVGKIYTATITIEPKRGYALGGIPENFFTINGAATTNSINSGVVIAVFPITVPVIQLTISDPVLTISKPYDENNLAAVTPGILSGVVGSDDVSITAIANYDSTLVGVNKTITVVYTLSGLDSANYIKPINYIITTGEITVVKLSSPSFTPVSGKIPLTLALVTGDVPPTGTSIQIEANNVGSNIYYTSDGSSPSIASTLYSGPITLNQDTTLKTIEVKDQYINSDIITSEYKINQSPAGTFTGPHGTVSVGDKLYIGTRSSPSTITVFNNPNDLTVFQTVTLTGHSNLDVLIYDSVNNKLYASCYDNDNKVTIISINPNNINEWSVVYHNLINGWAAPITTDGTYVYGVTYNSNPASVFKIRISDWILFSLINLNDGLGIAPWSNTYYPHAVSLISYADRKEMYITTVYDTPSRFIKVNLNGTMSYTSISLGGDYSVTDDIACRYIDETGALCYAGTDFNYPGYSTEKTGFKIDTKNMTFTKFSIEGSSSYGMFIKGNDLYNLGVSNNIIRYKNFDTSLPEIFSTPTIVPNEFLYSSTGKMFITDWKDINPSKLVEIIFKN